MITRVYIDGFKSFRDFEMELTPFTVVAGLNASGKSNLFDALELLSRLAATNLKEAFPERRGSVSELFTLVDNDLHVDTLRFEVDLLVKRHVKDNWGQEAEIKSPRLRYKLVIARKPDAHGFEELFVTEEKLEKIPVSEDLWAKRYLGQQNKTLWKSSVGGGSGKPFIETEQRNGVPTILIRQDGRQGGKATPANLINQTVLAGINSVDFPHVYAVKEEMRSWNFMQLNPDELRKPTTQDAKMSYYLTHSGANLAAALFWIKSEDESVLIDISRQLARFLPDFVRVDVANDEANKQFVIRLQHKDGKIFTSRVLSEGTLRILALIVMQFDPRHQGLLCFEEPENGIHPMRIKQMVDLLYGLSTNFEEDPDFLRQVIVNTHSPLLVREMVNFRHQNVASVWLSKMATLITDFQGRKVQIRRTEVNRVDTDGQTKLFQVQNTLSLYDLEQYLSTLDEDNSTRELGFISAIR